MKKEKSNFTFVIILLTIVVVLVLFFPKIYNMQENNNLPKVENIETNTKEEKSIDDELLSSLHYPIMRNSVYNKNTYYVLDTFRVSNMSNSDILYNAFINMEEVKIKNKQFNSDYIKLRIKNILGKSVNYKLENFIVPSDSSSSYKGLWVYDSNDSKYYYKGTSESVNTNIKYYNLEQFIKAKYNKDDVIVYKYVGFAKVENSKYIIYKDPNMTTKLNEGEFIDTDGLNAIFKSLNNKDKKIYRYTFKDTLCSYNEYCLYEGKWVNEL